MENVTDGAMVPAGEVAIADAPAAPRELGSQVVAPAEKERPSLDTAIDRAFDKVTKPEKAEVKPETKADKAEPPKEAQRAPDGKFAAKDQPEPKVEAPKVEAKPAPPTAPDSPHREAPSRFSPDAKTAWEAAPEPVKAEVHRAIRELEQGYQKNKADAEAYSELREYADLAKQHNTTIKNALQNYVGIERRLQQDPIGGLEQIVSNLGLKAPDGRPLTLQDIAAHVLNQSPDEQSARQSATIQNLNAKIAQLEQMVGGVTQTIQQQQEQATQAEVAAFAKDHPRLNELSEDIAFFLHSGKVPAHLAPRERLSEAYQLAERLNPAPAASAPAPVAAITPPAPLNPAGQKSISGAPSAGSNPARKGPAPSLDEALDKAFAGVG